MVSSPPPAPFAAAARVSCTAERACLPRLLALIDHACEQHGVAAGVRHDLHLIVEEASVNIMTHAYPPGDPGSMTLQVEAVTEGGRPALVIVIEDHGIPFDPLALPSPVREARLEDLQVGGLGVHLVRGLSDAQHYRHDPERGNVLTIKKYLVPAGHA